jgi:hypothetical protein
MSILLLLLSVCVFGGILDASSGKDVVACIVGGSVRAVDYIAVGGSAAANAGGTRPKNKKGDTPSTDAGGNPSIKENGDPPSQPRSLHIAVERTTATVSSQSLQKFSECLNVISSPPRANARAVSNSNQQRKGMRNSGVTEVFSSRCRDDDRVSEYKFFRVRQTGGVKSVFFFWDEQRRPELTHYRPYPADGVQRKYPEVKEQVRPHNVLPDLPWREQGG